MVLGVFFFRKSDFFFRFLVYYISNLPILINYYIKGGKIQKMNKSLEPLTDSSVSSQSPKELYPTKMKRFGISPALNLKTWTPDNVNTYQMSHVLKIRNLAKKNL